MQVEGKRDPRSVTAKVTIAGTGKTKTVAPWAWRQGEEVGGTGDCGFTTATLSPTQGFLLTLLGLPFLSRPLDGTRSLCWAAYLPLLWLGLLHTPDLP